MIQLMFVPMCTLLVTIPITFLVIGPVVTVVSNWIANGVVSLVAVSPVLEGIVAGAFWQLNSINRTTYCYGTNNYK